MTSDGKRWTLTQEAFDRLLGRLATERDAAAVKYEEIRRRLIKLFECQRCPFPEDLVDETMNRVARRLDEGVEIVPQNPYSYFHGVAVRVLYDSRRKERTPYVPPPAADDEDDIELRLACLNRCLDELPEERRQLILGYHEGERRRKIDNRVAMAARLGVPLNALRIRAHRIREKLEACVRECLEQPASARASVPN